MKYYYIVVWRNKKTKKILLKTFYNEKIARTYAEKVAHKKEFDNVKIETYSGLNNHLMFTERIYDL